MTLFDALDGNWQDSAKSMLEAGERLSAIDTARLSPTAKGLYLRLLREIAIVHDVTIPSESRQLDDLSADELVAFAEALAEAIAESRSEEDRPNSGGPSW